MIKKVLFALLIATVIVVAQSFISNIQASANELEGPVHWYSFTEAVEMQKKAPRPIMVDVYTSWCGPCKMMSANTFGNTIIAKYLNDNFYPVKFNAETRDSVLFNGLVLRTIIRKASHGRFMILPHPF